MGVGGQRHAPAAFTPGKDPVPIVQEAGWAPGPVWIRAENLTPSGFDLRTFEPVASRYTDYAIPGPTNVHRSSCKVPVILLIFYFNLNFLEILEKYTKMKFRKNRSSGSRVFP
jgi:hypothetical protein